MTTIDDAIEQVNYQYKLRQSLDCSTRIMDTTSIAVGEYIFKGMTFFDPVYVHKFNGWRDTAGTASGSTTIALKNKAGNTISTITFAQAGGDNLKAQGVIDTDYALIYPHDYLSAVVTAEETGNGAGIHLNIAVQKA
jgi:hypothetical protein